jgi:hypothetical protein
MGTVITFDRQSSTRTVRPEQVVQYYRASSFALSLDIYNNTASLPVNQPKDNDTAPSVLADTPLPAGLNKAFLACLNATIGFSVPLIEAKTSQALSKGTLAVIIIGSIFGAILLFVGLTLLVFHLKRKRVGRTSAHPWTTSSENEKPLPSLPSKGMFAFGKSGKTNGRENLGQYSSLETAPPPESQNLAVHGTSERLPGLGQMVDEPRRVIHAPPAANVLFRMPEPKLS